MQRALSTLHPPTPSPCAIQDVAAIPGRVVSQLADTRPGRLHRLSGLSRISCDTGTVDELAKLNVPLVGPEPAGRARLGRVGCAATAAQSSIFAMDPKAFFHLFWGSQPSWIPSRFLFTTYLLVGARFGTRRRAPAGGWSSSLCVRLCVRVCCTYLRTRATYCTVPFPTLPDRQTDRQPVLSVGPWHLWRPRLAHPARARLPVRVGTRLRIKRACTKGPWRRGVLRHSALGAMQEQTDWIKKPGWAWASAHSVSLHAAIFFPGQKRPAGGPEIYLRLRYRGSVRQDNYTRGTACLLTFLSLGPGLLFPGPWSLCSGRLRSRSANRATSGGCVCDSLQRSER
ncbi:hypothetical protein MAPG_08870 [Magnaporthiopsis poae ATCC 64411]|uniref:Uncharacterized protein n=1 Tax=Magnaporthiopsis poae (strain ATCC 64411 / 73-15) TaxID=644358 RepID=A0A0C4E8G7_MAGP6|nr:hypothetical protein MAPG_08870 [Magnaporthiopsis poae ATCC 64411]